MAPLSSMMTRNASVSPTRSAWTRRCSSARARSAPSAGRPRSSMSPVGVSSMSWRATTASSRAPGSPPARPGGASGSAGRRLDLSNLYRAVFDTMLPDATQVADPFHVVKLANAALTSRSSTPPVPPYVDSWTNPQRCRRVNRTTSDLRRDRLRSASGASAWRGTSRARDPWTDPLDGVARIVGACRVPGWPFIAFQAGDVRRQAQVSQARVCTRRRESPWLAPIALARRGRPSVPEQPDNLRSGHCVRSGTHAHDCERENWWDARLDAPATRRSSSPTAWLAVDGHSTRRPRRRQRGSRRGIQLIPGEFAEWVHPELSRTSGHTTLATKLPDTNTVCTCPCPRPRPPTAASPRRARRHPPSATLPPHEAPTSGPWRRQDLRAVRVAWHAAVRSA